MIHGNRHATWARNELVGDPCDTSRSGDRLRFLCCRHGFHFVYEVLSADGLDQRRDAPDVPLLWILLSDLGIPRVDSNRHPVTAPVACD